MPVLLPRLEPPPSEALPVAPIIDALILDGRDATKDRRALIRAANARRQASEHRSTDPPLLRRESLDDQPRVPIPPPLRELPPRSD
jgi:hypothetical protein